MVNLQRQLDNAERRIVVLERICTQQELEIVRTSELAGLAKRNWTYKLVFWLRRAVRK